MIVIGTTTAPYKVLTDDDAERWFVGAEELAQTTYDATGEDVTYFAALEYDGRGMDIYQDFLAQGEELSQSPHLGFDYYTFSLNDQEPELDGTNRLFRICTGRNLVHEYAQRDRDISHILFVDSDLIIPPDSVIKLLEVGRPICGGDVPSYCMNGPRVSGYDFPVEKHWNTAGFLMIRREVFRRLRWRADIEAGSTDDPCFAMDAEAAGFGETYVRKDLIGHHKSLVQLEHRGHDLKVY